MSDLVAYFGHHKCASTWIHRIFRECGRRAGLRHAYLHNDSKFGDDLGGYIQENGVDLLSYVNAEIDHVRKLADFRGFHVIRDPRDLLVSAYFSHLHSHPTHDWPELVGHRAELERLPKKEGLMLEMEFSSGVLDQMYRWDYEQENVLELRMEDLTPSPYKGFLEIFGFLGMLDESRSTKFARAQYEAAVAWNALSERFPPGFPRKRLSTIPADDVLSVVHESRFSKMAGGRSRGTKDERSHYRSGVAGDWRNHFDDDHLREFKSRFNQIVLALGYESDEDWS